MSIPPIAQSLGVPISHKDSHVQYRILDIDTNGLKKIAKVIWDVTVYDSAGKVNSTLHVWTQEYWA
jgi:hypothetical protein